MHHSRTRLGLLRGIASSRLGQCLLEAFPGAGLGGITQALSVDWDNAEAQFSMENGNVTVWRKLRNGSRSGAVFAGWLVEESGESVTRLSR